MYLQSNEANVVDAFSHFNSARQKLLALKEVNGKSLSKFCDSFVADKQFKVVDIIETESAEKNYRKCQYS